MFNSTILDLFFGFFSTVGEWFIFDLLLFSVFLIAIGLYELTQRR
jgi:hypothetical protein